MNPRKVSALSETGQAILADIQTWFSSALGEHVLQTEAAMLEQLLSGFFGYHLTQFSVQGKPLFQSSQIQSKVCVGMTKSSDEKLIASPVALPFDDDSIDVVLLHHILDYVESPQDVLREMARITLPMGNLVIVGFNPASFWGLWQGIARFRGNAPWNGSYIRPSRLMDWLNLLNFKIDRAQYAIYGPPSYRYQGRVRDYSQGFSRNLNLPIGSVYVIVAKKHIGSIRPIKPVWRSAQSFGQLSAVRSVKHDSVASIKHERDIP